MHALCQGAVLRNNVCARKMKSQKQNIMKQFDLDEYLANPSRKVVTRDGHSVRIRCTDKKGTIYPVVGLVDIGTREITLHYTRKGENWSSKESDRDIFFAPEKREGWVNIYKVAARRETLGYLQTR